VSGFLLDTNIPSEMLRPRPDANVATWVKRQANATLFVSVVTMGELRRGVTLLAEQSPRRAELERMVHEKVPSWFQDRILPVTRMIAERWGVLDGERQLAGRPLSIADGMIAATASRTRSYPRDAEREGLCRSWRRSPQPLECGMNLHAVAIVGPPR
jgi:predicted nucleic acid-binding protein